MEGAITPAQTVDSTPASTPVPAPASVVTPTEQPAAPDPAVRFRGLGTNFRAKLIGVDDVPDSRGDQMCQESLLKLKAAVLASGRHKQKIVINVSLEGIKIVDVLTGEVQHVHPVHRISFIARDLTDRRAFGYIYGAGEGRHQFFGIKTARVAETLVLALRDLFQVVYEMKKKEIEEAKGITVVQGSAVESAPPPASVPTQQNQPAVAQNVQVHEPVNDKGSILNLEQQLTNIQEGINNIDAIGPWPQELPTSPDTPGDMSGDLFGIAANAGPPATAQQSSYSDELFDLASPVAQPAPQPGAKLTKEQILSSFGGGQQQGMFPGQPGVAAQGGGMYMMPPNQMQYQHPQQQQQQFAAPQASMPMGMFPAPGPSPAIPPRVGAMRPPVAQPNPAQNPFGDSTSSQFGAVLAPTNTQQLGTQDAPQDSGKKADPFASLIPGMGADSADKKDMFKNFQMAKPPQPPPRTNPPVNGTPAQQPAAQQQPGSDFDSYFLNSVGGVPVTDNSVPAAPVQQNPQSASDLFGATTNGFGQPMNQVNNNQSLFG